jgi:copper chaperone CopZ
MSRHSLSVAGLRCAHCVQILERNLRRIPGVRRVEIRPVDEQVEVEADPRLVSEAVLAAAVRDSGLHVQRGRRPGFAEEEPEGAPETEEAAGGPEGAEIEPGPWPPPLPPER